MKLIVFLGNLGEKYVKTRHNAGFLFADYLQEKWGLDEWKKDKKFKGLITIITNKNRQFNTHNLTLNILLLKPQTYMNLSGEAVRKAMDFYKIPVEDLIVIFDDKDMQFSKLRFRPKGRDAGHKGIRSIIQQIGTEEFARFKIGIENREENSRFDTADFVLSRFNREELRILEKKVFPELEKKLLDFLKGEL